MVIVTCQSIKLVYLLSYILVASGIRYILKSIEFYMRCAYTSVNVNKLSCTWKGVRKYLLIFELRNSFKFFLVLQELKAQVNTIVT